MTDDELRAVAQGTGDMLDARVEPLERRLAAIEAELGRVNHYRDLEEQAIHEVAYDIMTSGDQSLLYQWAEDHHVSPKVAERMAQRYNQS